MAARSLVTLLIDDRLEVSKASIDTLRMFTDIIEITDIDDAIKHLNLLKQGEDVVDIILCDVNMNDNVCKAFPLTERARRAKGTNSRSMIAPLFDIAGLSTSGFKAYGPIIALPFVKYFKNGGVIAPISAYWQDKELMRKGSSSRCDGSINGYVYVTMALIWGQIDVKEFDPEVFGAKFSHLYNSANQTSLAAIVLESFFDSVRERRTQLFNNASVLPDLGNVTLDSILASEDIRVLDIDQDMQSFTQKSLYADYWWEHSRAAGDDGSVEDLRSRIAAEHTKFMNKHMALDKIYDFCRNFVRRYHDWFDVAQTEGADDQARTEHFEDIYAAVFSGMKLNKYPCPDIPKIGKYSDTPPHIRRYLFLLGQLYIYYRAGHISTRNVERTVNAKVRSSYSRAININRPVWNLFGFGAGNENILKDFAGLGGRLKRKNARVEVEFQKWMRPFVEEDDAKSWQQFNVLRPRLGNARFQWTGLDRDFGKRFWEEIKTWCDGDRADERAPFGLR